MRIKRYFAIIAAVAVIAFGIIVFAGSSLKAEDAELSQKLAEIADNQKRIMEDISVIKEELRIIKIRITQNQ
jgi:hypothetical protein